MPKKALPWAEEVGFATTICAALGCAVERSSKQFEIATVKGDGVQLVIYPHRSTAGHYSARVRDNGSKNKERALAVMRAMKNGDGLPLETQQRVCYCNMFHCKQQPGW